MNEFIDKILTQDQQLWLKYVLRQISANTQVSLRAFKIEFKGQVKNDFDPNEICKEIYYDRITLLGICLIEPKNEIIKNSNTILRGVYEILKASPDIKIIKITDLENKTGLDSKSIKTVFREFAFIGMFYRKPRSIQSNSITVLAFHLIKEYFGLTQLSSPYSDRNLLDFFSFMIDENVFNQYMKYSTIEQVLEDFIKNYTNEEKKIMPTVNDETPEQKRFRVLKIIYDLVSGDLQTNLSRDNLQEIAQIEPEKLYKILLFLKERNLIEMVSFNNLQITRLGIDEIEAKRENPEQGSPNFPANVYNTNFYGSVAGFQQGGQNNTQNISISNNPDLDKVLNSIAQLIRESSMPQSDKDEFILDVESIKKLASREPTPESIERAKSKINLLDTALKTTDIALKATPYFPQIVAFFDSLI